MDVEIDVKGYVPTLRAPRQERELHVLLFMIAAELRTERKGIDFSEALKEVIETWSAFLQGVADGDKLDPEIAASTAAAMDGDDLN